MGLLGLRWLNLSGNHLTGRIPEEIGKMTLLESLDLSVNQIDGRIPWSMSRLTTLNWLNLSSNQLTGEIPTSTQFQSFNESSFLGNSLCGPPLAVLCNRKRVAPDANTRGEVELNEDDSDGKNWGFIISIKVHFLISSMGVVYVLTTPIPEDGENTTMDQLRRMARWDNDDYVCIGLILNDDSDLHLTPYLRSSNSTHVESSTLIQNPVTIISGPAGVVQLSSNTRAEPYPSTSNPIRIIPSPAGIVQEAKLLKEKVFILDSDGALMSTQKYMQKIIKDVGEDDDFNSEA
uniref:Leucine-rich repeat-containing protein n=1 Tax=Tanacetum cinerariifolium TaxID=118510 RepID=A0A6L2LGY0_TANCI|nr:leucine-rich repeat-containing protein [Tanacetum cinerariifolium]